MTTGIIFFITASGLVTPIDEIPTADLAVPYDEPRSMIRWEEKKE